MSEKQLYLKEEVHQIVGCAMEVLNIVGHGYHEKIYENALVVEFGLQQIPVQQQPEFSVLYKGVDVGTYIPDLICFKSVVVDARRLNKSPTTKSARC